jgi:hypothetical protein
MRRRRRSRGRADPGAGGPEGAVSRSLTSRRSSASWSDMLADLAFSARRSASCPSRVLAYCRDENTGRIGKIQSRIWAA